MIISRTPYRISFFGGGSDYPGWFLQNGGKVLSTTIDKYCYLHCRYLPPFFGHRIRIVYSIIEECQNIDGIKHAAVREILKYLSIDALGLEIHHEGDLPARSGMGSSSAFSVGLLNALYGLIDEKKDPYILAQESIHVEQNLIKETVGSQDQVAAAFGGFNQINFKKDGTFEVNKIKLSKDRHNELNQHLMLVYTGLTRTAEDVAKTYANSIQDKHKLIFEMMGMVDEAVDILTSNKNIMEFGILLNKAWTVKRNLSSKVSNNKVDKIYHIAIKYGAVGGKLLGAGGGGFFLLFAPPDTHDNIKKALQEYIHVPFKIDFNGSEIIFRNHQKRYYNEEKMWSKIRYPSL